MTKLTNKLEIARLVLQVTELARKLETDQERVQPFVAEAVLSQKKSVAKDANHIAEYNEDAEEGGELVVADGEEQAALQEADKSSMQEPVAKAHQHLNLLQSAVFNKEGAFIPPADRLANFYRKYNRILLDCIAIDKEKERLSKENAQLEDLIQQFVDGTKISDSTLVEDNPLFVINGRYGGYLLLPRMIIYSA